MQKKLSKTEPYPVSEDTIFFANNIENEKGKNALDIGTGSGYLAQVLLSNFDLVVATDTDFNSLTLANKSVKNCVCCNIADAIAIDFDLIICNLPYLPSKDLDDRATDGLNEGLKIPTRIIKSAIKSLKEHGKIIFLTSSLANFEKLIQLTESFGLKTKIIGRKKLFFEELILVQAKK